MRYTTIIDLGEYEHLWRNRNIRLLWLELSLHSSYQQDDKDMYYGSLRTLAARAGITLSAARNGLRQLAAAELLQPADGGWKIRKYFIAMPIIPRRQKAPIKPEEVALNEQQRAEAERLRTERRKQQQKEHHTDDYIERYEKHIQLVSCGNTESWKVINNEDYKRGYIEHCQAAGRTPKDIAKALRDYDSIRKRFERKALKKISESQAESS